MSRRSEVALTGLGTPFTEFPDHPLFPVEEGEPNPQVCYIQITRHDRGVQKYGPVLKADELTTTDELFEMYGGGHYELWARGPSKMKADSPGKITGIAGSTSPGRSKPLSKDPTPEELRELDGYREASGPATVSTPPSSGGVAAGGLDMGSVLLAMMQMQAQQAMENNKMMMTIMQSSKQESAEIARTTAAAQQQMTTTMLTLASQNQASMMQFITAMAPGRSSGGPEEMAKWLKTAKDFGIGGFPKDIDPEDGGGLGKIVEDAADFVQGLVQLKGLPGVAPGPDPAAVVEPAPPGSAAALAQGMLKKTG